MRTSFLKLAHDLFGNRDFRGKLFQRAAVACFEVVHGDGERQQLVVELRFME